MNVRIEWKYKEGVTVPEGQPTSGRSEPLSEDWARNWIRQLDELHPEIEHTVVPVEEFDVLTGEGLFPKADPK